MQKIDTELVKTSKIVTADNASSAALTTRIFHDAKLRDRTLVLNIRAKSTRRMIKNGLCILASGGRDKGKRQ
jgi:hypothetical protein